MSSTPTTKQVQSPLNLKLTITKGKNEAILKYLGDPENSKAIEAGLKKVGTVHFARFLPEPGFLLGLSQTLWVITEFDGTFDDYITDFVNAMGPVFDALLSFVDAPPPLPVEDPKNSAAFGKWVKANDHASNLYSAYPNLTVQMILNS
ncbi:hypothetical protein [Granulicella mallensis]|uniref:Uncharacterized protein n=1 Tax=Granulicella mallensis (strain ATCC BAA-1857 / DSM 23137 / MP5ACTX8) TaxID=682795 RepID=G8NYJ7_GRAMM|nr:hypothetical protein [Granulicella mallensis]AEU39056.1 hypothetical protein AciX8_4787 [Granulicella mallensis MP5ACTX8]